MKNSTIRCFIHKDINNNFIISSKRKIENYTDRVVILGTLSDLYRVIPPTPLSPPMVPPSSNGDRFSRYSTLKSKIDKMGLCQNIH